MMDIHLTTAIIRLIVLLIVMSSCVRHRDILGMIVTVMYSCAIMFGTIGGWVWSTPLFATPLVFFISWYILKSHRGQL